MRRLFWPRVDPNKPEGPPPSRSKLVTGKGGAGVQAELPSKTKFVGKALPSGSPPRIHGDSPQNVPKKYSPTKPSKKGPPPKKSKAPSAKALGRSPPPPKVPPSKQRLLPQPPPSPASKFSPSAAPAPSAAPRADGAQIVPWAAEASVAEPLKRPSRPAVAAALHEESSSSSSASSSSKGPTGVQSPLSQALISPRLRAGPLKEKFSSSSSSSGSSASDGGPRAMPLSTTSQSSPKPAVRKVPESPSRMAKAMVSSSSSGDNLASAGLGLTVTRIKKAPPSKKAPPPRKLPEAAPPTPRLKPTPTAYKAPKAPPHVQAAILPHPLPPPSVKKSRPPRPSPSSSSASSSSSSYWAPVRGKEAPAMSPTQMMSPATTGAAAAVKETRAAPPSRVPESPPPLYPKVRRVTEGRVPVPRTRAPDASTSSAGKAKAKMRGPIVAKETTAVVVRPGIRKAPSSSSGSTASSVSSRVMAGGPVASKKAESKEVTAAPFLDSRRSTSFLDVGPVQAKARRISERTPAVQLQRGMSRVHELLDSSRLLSPRRRDGSPLRYMKSRRLVGRVDSLTREAVEDQQEIIASLRSRLAALQEKREEERAETEKYLAREMEGMKQLFDWEIKRTRDLLEQEKEAERKRLLIKLADVEAAYRKQLKAADDLAQSQKRELERARGESADLDKAIERLNMTIRHLQDVNKIAKHCLEESAAREKDLQAAIETAQRNAELYETHLKQTIKIDDAKELACDAICKGRALQIFAAANFLKSFRTRILQQTVDAFYRNAYAEIWKTPRLPTSAENRKQVLASGERMATPEAELKPPARTRGGIDVYELRRDQLELAVENENLQQQVARLELELHARRPKGLWPLQDKIQTKPHMREGLSVISERWLSASELFLGFFKRAIAKRLVDGFHQLHLHAQGAQLSSRPVTRDEGYRALALSLHGLQKRVSLRLCFTALHQLNRFDRLRGFKKGEYKAALYSTLQDKQIKNRGDQYTAWSYRGVGRKPGSMWDSVRPDEQYPRSIVDLDHFPFGFLQQQYTLGVPLDLLSSNRATGTRSALVPSNYPLDYRGAPMGALGTAGAGFEPNARNERREEPSLRPLKSVKTSPERRRIHLAKREPTGEGEETVKETADLPRIVSFGAQDENEVGGKAQEPESRRESKGVQTETGGMRKTKKESPPRITVVKSEVAPKVSPKKKGDVREVEVAKDLVSVKAEPDRMSPPQAREAIKIAKTHPSPETLQAKSPVTPRPLKIAPKTPPPKTRSTIAEPLSRTEPTAPRERLMDITDKQKVETTKRAPRSPTAETGERTEQGVAREQTAGKEIPLPPKPPPPPPKKPSSIVLGKEDPQIIQLSGERTGGLTAAPLMLTLESASSSSSAPYPSDTRTKEAAIFRKDHLIASSRSSSSSTPSSLSSAVVEHLRKLRLEDERVQAAAEEFNRDISLIQESLDRLASMESKSSEEAQDVILSAETKQPDEMPKGASPMEIGKVQQIIEVKERTATKDPSTMIAIKQEVGAEVKQQAKEATAADKQHPVSVGASSKAVVSEEVNNVTTIAGEKPSNAVRKFAVKPKRLDKRTFRQRASLIPPESGGEPSTKPKPPEHSVSAPASSMVEAEDGKAPSMAQLVRQNESTLSTDRSAPARLSARLSQYSASSLSQLMMGRQESVTT